MNSFLDKLFRWLRFRQVIKHIPQNSIVCDIGCGSQAYLLRQVSMFIKKGGKLIITTLTPLAKSILEILAKLRLIDSHEIKDHKNYSWPQRVKRMLYRAEYKDIKIRFFEVFLNSLIIAQK